VRSEQREAFEALVSARAVAMVRTGYLLTGDWGAAEDLVQGALAKTFARWHRLRDVGAGEAYARRIMLNTWRKARRRRWHGELPTAQLPDRPGHDEYRQVDDRALLAGALGRLPAAQRAVIVLRYFDDLPDPQIAEMLGCPPTTVRTRTARARHPSQPATHRRTHHSNRLGTQRGDTVTDQPRLHRALNELSANPPPLRTCRAQSSAAAGPFAGAARSPALRHP
jgi:RNA polymerase sigma-70 factor (sigma-E family)